MSTSPSHSHTRERRTIAGAELVEVRTFINGEAIPPTYDFQLKVTTWKLKGSLRPQIDALWKTFCEQALNLTSASSSNEITGQPQSTLSGTQTGQLSTAAYRTSVTLCRHPGCKVSVWAQYEGSSKCAGWCLDHCPVHKGDHD